MHARRILLYDVRMTDGQGEEQLREPGEYASAVRGTRSDVAPRPEATQHDRCAELLRSGGDCSALELSDIAQLLCDKRAVQRLLDGVTTLQVRRASGQVLDLSGQVLSVKLRLLECELGELDLTDARFIGVSLINCSVASLKAQRLACSGSLLIQCDQSERAQGPVLLDGAVLGGNLEVGTPIAARPDARLRVAGISADGIKVAGHAFFCGTICRGNLWLAGASVGRDLDLRATSVLAAGRGSTLSLHSSRVGGRLLLGPGARHGDTLIEATSNWRNLKVDSGVVARNARFAGKLKLDSAHIVGSLDLRGSRFEHRLQAHNMRVEGDVSLDGAALEFAPSRPDLPIHKAAALDLSGSRVTGCGFFGALEGKPFQAKGPLRLRACQFDERLLFNGAVLSCDTHAAVSMLGCSVGGQLQLAPARPEQLEYDLRDVRCSVFSLRGRPARARLNGLKYTVLDVAFAHPDAEARASGPYTSARAMLEIVQRFHGQPERFAPGPFKELEAYLHMTGLEGLAREVARERRRCELASDRACASSALARVRASIRSAILWCAGYGYSATTALALSIVTVAAFIVTARLWPGLTGQFCESTRMSCEPNALALLRLALDNFIPIVQLGLAQELGPNGLAARWLLAALRMAGWLLTTLVVVSWSGLMRKP